MANVISFDEYDKKKSKGKEGNSKAARTKSKQPGGKSRKKENQNNAQDKTKQRKRSLSRKLATNPDRRQANQSTFEEYEMRHRSFTESDCPPAISQARYHSQLVLDCLPSQNLLTAGDANGIDGNGQSGTPVPVLESKE